MSRRGGGAATTHGQLAESNARNAQKSIGPRTPEEKTVSRLNALRHGLLAREMLLPGEDAEAFTMLRARLRANVRPVGELEELLACNTLQFKASPLWR